MTYTTGELAELAGVSVRTVQYYDGRGIVTPSFFSEGGRRLYTDDDLATMKLVLYLRELDMSLGNIAEILKEGNSERVIACILAEQEKALSYEVEQKKEKLSELQSLRGLLRTTGRTTPEAIGSVAKMMENRDQLEKTRKVMLFSAIPFVLLELGGILLGILLGVWWPYLAVILAAIPYAVVISWYYFKRIDYVCPECSKTFHPKLKEAFFANHTPRTRKLRCPHCNYKGFCVEVHRRPEEK